MADRSLAMSAVWQSRARCSTCSAHASSHQVEEVDALSLLPLALSFSLTLLSSAPHGRVRQGHRCCRCWHCSSPSPACEATVPSVKPSRAQPSSSPSLEAAICRCQSGRGPWPPLLVAGFVKTSLSNLRPFVDAHELKVALMSFPRRRSPPQLPTSALPSSVLGSALWRRRRRVKLEIETLYRVQLIKCLDTCIYI
jgi:hypothetical protein